MDVGVHKWRRSQGTGTGGGLRESWTGRGGTEDHRGRREGRWPADEPDQLWDLVVVHSRKRRGDVV